jgi:hypothetical protein
MTPASRGVMFMFFLPTFQTVTLKNKNPSPTEITGAGAAAPATMQLRREPFEFGLLPASYLLPRVETAAALGRAGALLTTLLLCVKTQSTTASASTQPI